MKKAVLFLLAAIIVFAPNLAFAIDWTLPRQNLDMDPAISDYVSSNTDSFKIELNEPGQILSPVAKDGILYFSEYHSTLHLSYVRAVSIHTGAEIWENEYPKNASGLVISENTIYVGADKLYALDKMSGEELWSMNKNFYGGDIISAKPVSIVDQFLFVTMGVIGGVSLNIINLDNNQFEILENIYYKNGTEIMADENNIFIVYSINTFYSRVDAYSRNDMGLTWSSGLCDDNASYSMLDRMNGVVYVGSNAGRFCGYDSSSGSTLFKRQSAFRKGFVSYGDQGYGFYTPQYTNDRGILKTFFLSHRDGVIPDQTTIMGGGEIFETDPVEVNGTMYGGTSRGRLWGKDMESIDAEFWQIDEDEFDLREIIYASGKLIITSLDRSGNTGAKLFVYNQSDFDFENLDYEVELSSPYKTDGEYNAYLGQTHSHYIPDVNWMDVYRSDITRNPAETVEEYKNAGYDFMALTEHNQVVEMPLIDGIMQIKDAEESTQGWFKHHILSLGIITHIDESASDQDRINQVLQQGGLPIFAHPDSWVYGATTKTLLNLNNLKHIEIYNNAIRKSPIPDAYALDDADKLLSKKKNIFLTAGDDYTPGMPGFDGAGVVVFSKNLSQEEILQNMKDGNFYALQGSEAPRITVNVAGNQISINSDRESEIQFIGEDGKILQKSEDVLSSTYSVVGDEVYVRAQVTAGRKSAWTQPIFVSRKLSKSTSDIGEHFIDLGQAKLISNNSDQVTAKILPITEYPDSAPPLGFFSEVYSLCSQGDVYGGTKLVISYDSDNILTSANNLSLYVFSEIENTWEKIASVIDFENNTVYADLEHFSLYTLSADEPEDMENPTVKLISPTEFNNLNGEISFEATATDNNAVVSVDYYLEDKLIYSDSDSSDGWLWHADLNNIADGNYELKIVAYDLSGNKGEIFRQLGINSGISEPSVTISNPVAGTSLEGEGVILGSVESEFVVHLVSLTIDGLHIGEVSVADNNFELPVDWDEFVVGEHILRAEVADVFGNTAHEETLINIGQSVEATILSPQNDIYLQSDEIFFSYETKTLEGVEAYLDRGLVNKQETRYGYELGFGEHEYKVMFENTILDSKDFVVQTDLQDVTRTINLLYLGGHIKNNGIRNALIVKIISIDRFDKWKCEKFKEKRIINTLRWIENKNKKRRVQIDNYAKEIIENSIDLLYN